MSGGCFNYLYHAMDIDDLISKKGDLHDMANRLAGLGYATDAAAETEELLLLVRQWEMRAEVRIKRLTEVWRAVEWFDEGDWPESAVHRALAAYRGEPGEEVATGDAGVGG